MNASDSALRQRGYITPQAATSVIILFGAAVGSLLSQPAMLAIILCVVAAVLTVHQWRGGRRRRTTRVYARLDRSTVGR